MKRKEIRFCAQKQDPPRRMQISKPTRKTGHTRYIISYNQSAIEKLAQWVEFRLKYLARQHSTYLKDTKHFLNFIEEINEEQGPFKENEIIMISKDIRISIPAVKQENI